MRPNRLKGLFLAVPMLSGLLSRLLVDLLLAV